MMERTDSRFEYNQVNISIFVVWTHYRGLVSSVLSHILQLKCCHWFSSKQKRNYQCHLIWSVLIWHYPGGVKFVSRIFYNNYLCVQADVRCLMCLSECNKTSLQMSDQWKSFVIQNIRFWSGHEAELICFAGGVQIKWKCILRTGSELLLIWNDTN